MRSYTPAINLLLKIVQEKPSLDEAVREKTASDARVLIEGAQELQKLEEQQAALYYYNLNQKLCKDLGRKIDMPVLSSNIFDMEPSLLGFASANGHTAIVYALLDAGTNPNNVYGHGQRPLDHAIANKHIAISQALIARGAISGYYSPPVNELAEWCDYYLNGFRYNCCDSRAATTIALLIHIDDQTTLYYHMNHNILFHVLGLQRTVRDFQSAPSIQSFGLRRNGQQIFDDQTETFLNAMHQGKLYELKNQLEDAKNCYESARNAGCLYAERALGDMAQRQNQFTQALTYYKIAINRGDAGGIARLVDMAEYLLSQSRDNHAKQKNVELQSKHEISPFQSTMQSIFKHLQSVHLVAYLAPAQWRFLVRVAMESNLIQNPVQQAHFVLRLSKKAIERSHVELRNLAEKKQPGVNPYTIKEVERANAEVRVSNEMKQISLKSYSLFRREVIEQRKLAEFNELLAREASEIICAYVNHEKLECDNVRMILFSN